MSAQIMAQIVLGFIAFLLFTFPYDKGRPYIATVLGVLFAMPIIFTLLTRAILG